MAAVNLKYCSPPPLRLSGNFFLIFSHSAQLSMKQGRGGGVVHNINCLLLIYNSYFLIYRNKKKKKKMKRRPVLKRRKVKTTRFRLKQPNQMEDEQSEDHNKIDEDQVEATTFADLSRGPPLSELLLTTRSPKTIIISDKILPKSR